MEDKNREWHTIIDGSNCPPDSAAVIGYWELSGDPFAEICKYKKETREWFSLKGDPLRDPDYWIECP